MFEHRVVRRIFGTKRDVVMAGLRKLHNEELCDLYSLSSIIRMIKLRMKCVRHLAPMRKWNTQRLLVGKPEKKRLQ
jgi:hypothetical protein